MFISLHLQWKCKLMARIQPMKLVRVGLMLVEVLPLVTSALSLEASQVVHL
jgi:hypothetical protein